MCRLSLSFQALKIVSSSSCTFRRLNNALRSKNSIAEEEFAQQLAQNQVVRMTKFLLRATIHYNIPRH